MTPISLKKVLANMLTTSKEVLTITNSNFAHYSDSGKLTVRKQGKVVTLMGELKNTAQISMDAYGTTVFDVAQLPEKYRPPFQVMGICQGSSSAIWLGIVYTSGVVRISRYRNVVGASSPTTLGINTWFPICMTWIVD